MTLGRCQSECSAEANCVRYIWTAQPHNKCELVENLAPRCSGNPPLASNSNRGNCAGESRQGASCRLACDAGYITRGDLAVTCQADGQFSAPSGECLATPMLEGYLGFCAMSSADRPADVQARLVEIGGTDRSMLLQPLRNGTGDALGVSCDRVAVERCRVGVTNRTMTESALCEKFDLVSQNEQLTLDLAAGSDAGWMTIEVFNLLSLQFQTLPGNVRRLKLLCELDIPESSYSQDDEPEKQLYLHAFPDVCGESTVLATYNVEFQGSALDVADAPTGAAGCESMRILLQVSGQGSSQVSLRGVEFGVQPCADRTQYSHHTAGCMSYDPGTYCTAEVRRLR